MSWGRCEPMGLNEVSCEHETGVLPNSIPTPAGNSGLLELAGRGNVQTFCY